MPDIDDVLGIQPGKSQGTLDKCVKPSKGEKARQESKAEAQNRIAIWSMYYDAALHSLRPFVAVTAVVGGLWVYFQNPAIFSSNVVLDRLFWGIVACLAKAFIDYIAGNSSTKIEDLLRIKGSVGPN